MAKNGSANGSRPRLRPDGYVTFIPPGRRTKRQLAHLQKHFGPGHKKVGGRKRGGRNVFTRVLKEAIILAAEAVGEDGRGNGKLVGYLRRIARAEPKAFCGLLGRLLPLQVTGPNNGPLQIISSTMSPKEAADAYALTLRQVGEEQYALPFFPGEEEGGEQVEA